MAKIKLGVYELPVTAINDDEPGGAVAFITHPDDLVPPLKFPLSALKALGYKDVRESTKIWCDVRAANLSVLSTTNKKVIAAQKKGGR